MKQYFRKNESRFSLRMLLSTGVTLCIVLLVLLIGVIWVPQMNNQVEENAIERTRESVYRSVDSLTKYLDGLAKQLRFACAFMPTNTQESTTEWQQAMVILKQNSSDISEFAFFDENGNCLYNTAGGVRLSSEEVRQTDWFSQSIKRQGNVLYFSVPHVQNLFVAHRLRVITLSQAVDYYDTEGMHTGVLLMDVNYSSLMEIIDTMKINQSGYTYLIDPEERIIAHPRLAMLYEDLETEYTEAVRKKVVGFTNDEVNGRKRLLFIMTLPQTNWRLVGVAYMDELLVLQGALVKTFMMVLCIAILLGFMITSILAHGIVIPIQRLESQISGIEQDLHVTFKEEGYREIRAVYRTINRLLENTDTLMKQVLKEQETKRLYELNALQAQINPHFLYNTLDSIIWMEEQGQNREAIVMVSALADLFRISISKGKEYITVADEIAHVQNYIIIQKMRFGNRFEYEINVQPGIEQDLTLKLLIQPIVENAINHAIDEYRVTPLHIRISARADENSLFYIIEDDGVGIPEQRLKELLVVSSGKSGIGLKNVHERIRLSCGEPYGLHVESEEEVGTKVSIWLPRKQKTLDLSGDDR